MTRQRQSRIARNAEWRRRHSAGETFSQIARADGYHHTTVMYAINEEYAAKRRDQMTFRWRLNRATD